MDTIWILIVGHWTVDSIWIQLVDTWHNLDTDSYTQSWYWLVDTGHNLDTNCRTLATIWILIGWHYRYDVEDEDGPALLLFGDDGGGLSIIRYKVNLPVLGLVISYSWTGCKGSQCCCAVNREQYSKFSLTGKVTKCILLWNRNCTLTVEQREFAIT